MRHASDQHLLAEIARGDRSAFAELFDRFSSRVFGLCLKLVHDRPLAEDVLQDVFLHVWRQAGRYNPQLGKPLVWLMLVARARAIDAIRRRTAGSTAEVESGRAFSLNGAWTNGGYPEETRLARHALSQLPEEQSDAISLAFHGGLTCTQIAELRGIPLGTVKTRIRLGMRKLRDSIDRQHDSHEVSSS